MQRMCCIGYEHNLARGVGCAWEGEMENGSSRGIV